MALTNYPCYIFVGAFGVEKAVLLGESRNISRSQLSCNKAIRIFITKNRQNGEFLQVFGNINPTLNWNKVLQDDLNLHLMRDFSNMELQSHSHILCAVGTIKMLSFHYPSCQVCISHPLCSAKGMGTSLLICRSLLWASFSRPGGLNKTGLINGDMDGWVRAASPLFETRGFDLQGVDELQGGRMNCHWHLLWKYVQKRHRYHLTIKSIKD